MGTVWIAVCRLHRWDRMLHSPSATRPLVLLPVQLSQLEEGTQAGELELLQLPLPGGKESMYDASKLSGQKQ